MTWLEFGLTLGPPWPDGPGLQYRDVAGVAIGPDDQVYLFTRHEGRVLVFTRDGRLIRSFGAGVFTMPHALEVDPDGCVYCVDSGDHTVRKFSPTGELLMTLGTPHAGSDTGWRPLAPDEVEISAVEAVRRPGGPFNGCTDVAIGPDGDLYVSDGYRNCQVHRFTASGDLVHSFGGVGASAGQFHLPHSVVSDGSRLYVADRENDRIQVFDLAGEHLATWGDLQRPTDIALDPTTRRAYVTELPRPVGNRGFVSDTRELAQHARLSVLDLDGVVLGRWGRPPEGAIDGYFIAPHSVAVDSAGTVYVGEVTYTFGILTGYVGEEYADHRLQRFEATPTAAAAAGSRPR